MVLTTISWRTVFYCYAWRTLHRNDSVEHYLKMSHFTRTRRSHQITAPVLNKLWQDAWKSKIRSKATNEQVLCEEWCQAMIRKHSIFQYWDIILDPRHDFCLFSSCKWFWAVYRLLGGFNTMFFCSRSLAGYACWVPIHLRDITSFSCDVKDDFQCCWVFRKAHNKLSCIPNDQAHEQNNELVKGCGGAVRLIENLTAFRSCTRTS